MTRPVPPRRVFHVANGRPYHEANSGRGVRAARRGRYRWIDLDAQVTKDGVLVITHWHKPLALDGFADPLGLIPRDALISRLTWAEVSRLRTRKGHRIWRADVLVPYAVRLGLRVELELKTRVPAATLRDLRATLDRPERVQVKALAPFPRAYSWLREAHEAGFVTMILGRDCKVPAYARAWINYRRGPVRWV